MLGAATSALSRHMCVREPSERIKGEEGGEGGRLIIEMLPLLKICFLCTIRELGKFLLSLVM